MRGQASGFCYFILFLDLTKAFDHAVREMVTGWMRGQGEASPAEKAIHLTRLGIPADVVQEVVAWINESGGLLRQLGADESVCALVNSVHDGAWFRLPGDAKYVVSVSGGRQGCKLGALIFNLIYRLALKKLRRALETSNTILRIVQVGGDPFWSIGSTSVGWGHHLVRMLMFSRSLTLTMRLHLWLRLRRELWWRPFQFS